MLDISNIKDLRAEFQKKGFCVIKNAFSTYDVSELLKYTEKVLTSDDGSEDFLRINNSNHIHKIKYMFEKEEVFLKYLVHPSVIKIVSELSPDVSQIVPSWEDMLIKVPNCGIPVTVHQDLALQSVNSDVFSMCIYIHDSDENPVYYLPESQNMGPLTKSEIYKVYEENKNNFVPAKVKAGDIVIHNVKTVHFSEENFSSSPRYTWYLEFRTVKQLIDDSPWDDDWIMSRRAIWAYALKKYCKDIDHLLPDIKSLDKYLKNIKFKISHTNETINYDMKSPYNHFA